jgi:glycosyltransferase involved in cell wall biosynthesis
MIFLNYITYIFFASIFIFKIRKETYDLVFCYATSPIFQAIPALIYSKIKKIPSFIWIQDLWPDVLKDIGYIKSNFLLKIIQIFVNFIYNYADCVFAQSKEMKNEIKKKASIKNAFILHNP